MAWTPARWIPAFFAALNQRFPARDRATDGVIGDRPHQDEVSGHNPDDTPGVRAERQDADTKPEVRAADADADLRDPGGITMQNVVDAILATPEDRSRLIYIIFNGWIWRASGGWHRERYRGKDKHTTHGHFSGDPASDEDGRPWTSITGLGDKMAGEYSPDTACALAIGATSAGDVASTAPGWDGSLSVYNLRAMTTGQLVRDNAPVTGDETRLYNLRVIVEGLKAVASAVAAVNAAVAELRELVAGAGGVDQAVVVAALESDAGQAALVRAHNTGEDS